MASETRAKASDVRRLFGRGRRGTTAASLSRSSHKKQWSTKSTQLLQSVFFSWPKKGHSAPDVMWACALFRGISHKIKFEYVTLFMKTVCLDKTVIQGATDLMQQPEFCE